MKNIYDKINDQVLEGLEKEGLNWFKPWKSGGANQPMNYSTGKFYRGFNIFMLNFVMVDKEYEYNQWMTYKQAQAKGGQVKSGETAIDVYFYKVSYQNTETGKYSDTPTGDLKKWRKSVSMRYFKVFNIAQTEGLEPLPVEEFEPTEDQTNEMAKGLCDSYINKQNISFSPFGDSAFYSPSRDHIEMPPLETFCDSDSYYKTLFHEMAHSTGHKSRLKRATLMDSNKWGDTTYSKEELVAEISAMYLVGILGLEPQDSSFNSQAYIKGWCKHLRDKSRECVNAMQQATKVVEFIQG
jgi:antirestriction protein ArdC